MGGGDALRDHFRALLPLPADAASAALFSAEERERDAADEERVRRLRDDVERFLSVEMPEARRRHNQLLIELRTELGRSREELRQNLLRELSAQGEAVNGFISRIKTSEGVPEPDRARLAQLVELVRAAEDRWTA